MREEVRHMKILRKINASVRAGEDAGRITDWKFSGISD